MPEISTAETYFIILMMLLILVVCGAAMYFFFRQYKIEMKMRAEEKARRLAAKQSAEEAETN